MNLLIKPPYLTVLHKKNMRKCLLFLKKMLFQTLKFLKTINNNKWFFMYPEILIMLLIGTKKGIK